MNEIDYNALFGVEGENEQESAEPAETEQVEETESAGENEQETAEPAVSEKQSKETNAMYAAARRKAEQERDAAVESAKKKAQEEADKYIAEAFKNSGLTNPYTGEAISSREQYEAYRQSYDSDRISRVRDGAGMSDSEFDQFVASLPVVREATEAKAAAEKAQAAARDAEINADIERQLAEINTIDPSIKTLSDLTKLDNYQELYDKVGKGYSIIDAYKLTNWDRSRDAAVKAAKQEARNAGSKAHLTRTEGRGNGALSVPEDVMREFRTFNPTASEADITAYYNKFMNK